MWFSFEQVAYTKLTNHQKSLPGTNALAYFVRASLTKRKRLMALAPGFDSATVVLDLDLVEVSLVRVLSKHTLVGLALNTL